MSTADEIDLEKQALRRSFRDRRIAMTPEQRLSARDGITEQLRALVEGREARSVSCYSPLPEEPDTSGFLAWVKDSGIDVLLPAARYDGLLDWIRPSWEGEVTGAYGIPEPLGTILSPMSVGDTDLMLIPACAVDRNGARLGWGKGYFDKSLGSMDRRPPVFAIVFDDEFVDHVPSDVHDVPVTGVVTPTRIVYLDDPQ